MLLLEQIGVMVEYPGLAEMQWIGQRSWSPPAWLDDIGEVQAFADLIMNAIDSGMVDGFRDRRMLFIGRHVWGKRIMQKLQDFAEMFRNYKDSEK